MKLSTAILTSLAFVTAGAANATILVAQDNFNDPSIGFKQSWTLAAPAKKGAAAPAQFKNGALVFTGNSDSAASRKLQTRQVSDVFVDFTLSYTGTLGNNDFIALWFGNSAGPNIGMKANCDGTCTDDLFARTTSTGNTYLGGSNLVQGVTYQVSGHLYKSKTGPNNYYDSFDAWFKPSASDLATAFVSTKVANSTVKGFDTLGFRTANIDNNVAITIDNLRVANVPEPGSLALMGLALAGFAAARRRKRG